MARARVSQKKKDEVRELVEARDVYREVLDPYYKAMGREYDFGIKMKQHKDEEDYVPGITQGRKRKSRLKIVTGDVPNILRYSAAILSGASIYIGVQPRGPGRDENETTLWQKASAVAQAAMLDQVHDVDIGYPSVRRRMVRMGGAARAGSFRLDVCPGGPLGAQIVPTVVDPRNLWWSMEYLHFNDYGCPMLGEDFRVSVERAKSNPDWHWDNPDALRPDDGEKAIPKKAGPTADENALGDDDDFQMMTLSRVWMKDDSTVIDVEIGESTQIPSEKWFMSCPTCGYSESDLVDSPGYDGSTLPESHPCPQCGDGPEGQPAGLMHRIETSKTIGKVPAYNDKHRYVIIAPFCPEAGFARDGPWLKGLLNFPYGMFVPDPYPIEPYGNSDTARNQDLASIKNATIASGFEQMERNKDLLLAKEDSIWDDRHEPYMFDGSGDFVAYVTSYDDLNGMKHFQGSGLNAAFPAWIGTINTELQKFPGIGQINATASEIKGMQVGTVARVQETGDVPLDEQAKILREVEEMGFNRWLELLIAYASEDFWVDMAGADGSGAFQLFSAPNMPPMRLKVHAAPNLNLVDMEKVEKIKGLIGAPPELIKFALKDANVPAELIAALIAGQPLAPTGGSDNSKRVPPPMPGGGQQ